MKQRPVGPAEVFQRVLTPRWAIAPTSGAGAAKGGGRFNRPGIEALYLSATSQTAEAEYRQDAELMPPGTGEAAKGILFPSTMDPGGTNLVVFIELLGPSDQIEVHDPSDDLPRDQSSWTPVD